MIRRRGATDEVLVIHRPRYDDWTLPKGHLDPGESAAEAALREVREETGYECVLGDEVAAVQYLTREGVRKQVRYWVMEVAAGDFSPNAEVDEVRWVEATEAVVVLSYDLDRTLVRTALHQK